MAKTRKKKVPMTSELASSSSSSHTTRAIIRRFHVLLKKQRQLRQNASTMSSTLEMKEIEQEIEKMGGLATYQRMSSVGQDTDRGGGSQKVLIKWLVDMGLPKMVGSSKLSLLEVGALKPDNYASCSTWMNTTPIDLRSRHPAILEQDFFMMDTDKRWDIISLSLVVNFVPDPSERGRMLRLAYMLLRESGLLFLALPLPCVENSRYLTMDHLQSLMAAIGFVEIEKKWRRGGKMAYWLYRKAEKDPCHDLSTVCRKSVLRQGSSRNNFAILLKD